MPLMGERREMYGTLQKHLEKNSVQNKKKEIVCLSVHRKSLSIVPYSTLNITGNLYKIGRSLNT